MPRHQTPMIVLPAEQLELPCFQMLHGETRPSPPCSPTHIVLIDLENTQPKNLSVPADLPFKVYVFIGEHQSKISLDFAAAMQQLGDNATYTRMAGHGRDALDFHIAYYIGELAASEPDAIFYIVSADRGFDPLIRHLGEREGQRIQVYRVGSLAAVPAVHQSIESREEEYIDAIKKNLLLKETGRPRKVKSLKNAINALLRKQLHADEVAALVGTLQARGFIAIHSGAVNYLYPDAQ